MINYFVNKVLVKKGDSGEEQCKCCLLSSGAPMKSHTLHSTSECSLTEVNFNLCFASVASTMGANPSSANAKVGSKRNWKLANENSKMRANASSVDGNTSQMFESVKDCAYVGKLINRWFLS